jgi:hypothetical protein
MGKGIQGMEIINGKRATGRIYKYFITAAAALSGLVLLTCVNPIDPNIIITGNFEKVTARNSAELLGFLQSASTSYDISLDLGQTDIYLQSNLNITKDMIIRGTQAGTYTIHTVNNAGGTGFQSLNLGADLYLVYCNLTLYDAPSATSTSLSFSADKTLRMSHSTLTLKSAYAQNATATLRGTVQLMEGGAYVNEINEPDNIFRTSVKSLVVEKGATALMQTGGTDGVSIGGSSPTFDITSGSFTFERGMFIVDGESRMQNSWPLKNGQSLHIKSGELLVPNGMTLSAEQEFKEVILDGNIMLGPGSMLHIDTNPLLKMSGNGAIIIEYSDNLPEVSMYPDPDAKIGVDEPDYLGLEPGTNGRLEISAKMWRLTRTGSGSNPATFNLTDVKRPHYVADGMIMLVEEHVHLYVKSDLAVLRGGILEVRGSIIVNEGGLIFIANDDDLLGFGFPKGHLRIEDGGLITVSKDGVLWDTTATFIDNSFFIPSYGKGTLAALPGGAIVISRKASMPPIPTVVVGNVTSLPPGLLQLENGTGNIFETRGHGTRSTYNYWLSGKATLNVPTGTLTLEGEFNLRAGAELTVTGGEFNVTGQNNYLRGPDSGSSMPKITATIGASVKINTTTLTGPGPWTWNGNGWI